MSKRFIALSFIHNSFSFVLVGQNVAAASNQKVDIRERLLCLLKRSSVSKMEKIVNPVRINSHRLVGGRIILRGNRGRQRLISYRGRPRRRRRRTLEG
jgi:hypothetical protein